METVLEKFKELSLKKKIIAIAVVFLVIMVIFTRLTGGSKDKREKETTAPLTALSTTETTVQSTTETTTESTTEDTTAETTTEKETEKATEKRTGIDPEFKEFWDGYERFMDSYIEFMKNPDVTSSDYLRFIADYNDWLEKTDEYEKDDTLTDEEVRYMEAVEARVSAKMIAYSLS